MPRFNYVRILVLAVLVGLMLPSFAQAKRFKRYPGDVEKKKAKPAAPAPEAEPVEAPSPPEPSGTEEDKARGYRITQWAGYDNFECLYCPFKHLDVDKVVRHTAQHR